MMTWRDVIRWRGGYELTEDPGGPWDLPPLTPCKQNWPCPKFGLFGKFAPAPGANNSTFTRLELFTSPPPPHSTGHKAFWPQSWSARLKDAWDAEKEHTVTLDGEYRDVNCSPTTACPEASCMGAAFTMHVMCVACVIMADMLWLFLCVRLYWNRGNICDFCNSDQCWVSSQGGEKQHHVCHLDFPDIFFLLLRNKTIKSFKTIRLWVIHNFIYSKWKQLVTWNAHYWHCQRKKPASAPCIKSNLSQALMYEWLKWAEFFLNFCPQQKKVSLHHHTKSLEM